MATRPKRPRDQNQLAKLVVDLSTGDAQDPNLNEGKNIHAVLLGRLGGLKGGPARATSMSGKERKKSAQVAAKARWRKKKK